jgi:hypothetical protein
VRPSLLTIDCKPFDGFKDAIRSACDAGEDWISPQFEYLQSYLRGDARAKTLVIEKPYVDRHYLEEYSAYYFSALRNGGPTTTRIHLFSEEFDREKLSEWIQQAASGDFEKQREIRERLDDAYLGFMTVRPIPSAPIGRTILRPYEDKPTRSYIPSEGGHTVHLMGIALNARGLPFQQQEQAVGACATTALWSAMSRVVRADGGRAPTPYSVTQAATRHYLQDRALPAVSGLELAQLTAAVHEFGYSPYVLKPAAEYATFILSLKCYLRSGIPAVLVLEDARGGYHAVTASGYRMGDEEEPATDIRVAFPDEGGELLSKGISRLYVHDDHFGPYVRMRLKPPPDQHSDTVLERVGNRAGDPAQGAGGKICYALFPLYPKIRLTARELIGLGLDMVPAVRGILSEAERAILNVEVFFMHGGRYQKQLLSLGLEDPKRVERFLSGTALSRYVGIVRFQLDDAALVDVVCDTTDIRRDYPRRAPVLAVFPFAGKHVEPFQRLLAPMAPWAMVV